MKQSATIAITSISALLLAGGVVLNALYRPPSGRADVPGLRGHGIHSPNSAARAGVKSSSTARASVADPQEIAAAFGWVVAPKAPPKAKTAPRPRSNAVVVAPWIHYVGTITGADGVAYEYFKDEKSGGMIKTALGRDIDGWRLEKVGHTADILEHEKEKLKVRLGS